MPDYEALITNHLFDAIHHFHKSPLKALLF